MVGASAAVREVFALISRIAESPLPVLIQGETGTGKELVARAVHRRSRRTHGPFEALNCGAIPEGLAEAELFGHERGAFTGAHERRAGMFERANGGTLFLDEVGDLPIALQVKLLRALDRGEVAPVGSRRPLVVDVRVVAATNLDLEEAVKQGRFRQDLYWRLNAARIEVPAVRHRGGDVAILLGHVLHRVRVELRRPDVLLSPAARAVLLAHDWPGNVREMEQTVRQAVLSAEDDVIEASRVPRHLRGEQLGLRVRDLVLPAGTTIDLALTQIRSRLEPAWIEAALRSAGGNRTRAAEALGMDRRTLYDKMIQYRIQFAPTGH
jgi:DNA-binding NtrC family response regulator